MRILRVLSELGLLTNKWQEGPGSTWFCFMLHDFIRHPPILASAICLCWRYLQVNQVCSVEYERERFDAA